MNSLVTIRMALATFMGITLTLILGTTLYTTMAALGQEQYSYVTQWGSTGTGFGTFKQPLEISVDQDDNVYVTDFTSVSNKVQKFTNNGSFLTSWGTLGFGPALFTSPSGIGVSSSGNVYVADFGSPDTAVQEFTNEGTFLRMWGSFGLGDGQFINPGGLTVDSSDNIY